MKALYPHERRCDGCEGTVTDGGDWFDVMDHRDDHALALSFCTEECAIQYLWSSRSARATELRGGSA